MTKLKTRMHFNRINMQRKNPAVWTAHNSRGCFQGEKLVIMKDGELLLETKFNPDGRQPRAYFSAKAHVFQHGKTVVVYL